MGRIAYAAAGLALVATVSMPASPSVAAPPAGGVSWWDLWKTLNSTKYGGFSVVSRFTATASASGPAEPKPSDPCADAAPAGAEPSAGSAGPVASVTLQKGAGGPTVSETLTAVGSEAAGDAVEQLEQILDRCPVTEDATYRTTFARWTAPELGDASVGYTLVIESKSPDEPTVRIKTAVVAHDDVLAHFTMTDGDAGDAAQFTKIVRTGTAELADISGVRPA